MAKATGKKVLAGTNLPAWFIELHALTSYVGALLNRDDTGHAKRMQYGGASRTRVSSQCLKRHWRTHDGEHSLKEIGIPMSFRSRYTFEEKVAKPLIAEGFDAAQVRETAKSIMYILLGDKGSASKAKDDDTEEADEMISETKDNGQIIKTDQITVTGEPEINYIKTIAREVCKIIKGTKQKPAAVIKEVLGKDGIENLKALQCGAGLDAAMFGRMVTSDNLARVDAALHVGHAYTAQEERKQQDYFSAIDNLQPEATGKSMGSGHINATELTTGLYYSYICIDYRLLVSNLTGCSPKDFAEQDHAVAGDVVRNMVFLMSTVSPGAKRGSTAPYSYAQFLLVEKGRAQPRRLDRAFEEPISEHGSVTNNAVNALSKHYSDLIDSYGKGNRNGYHLMVGGNKLAEKVFGPRKNIMELAEYASNIDLM